MSQGLQSADSTHTLKEGVKEDEDEEVIGDLSSVSYNPPVRREDKKTERQRRKEREKLVQVIGHKLCGIGIPVVIHNICCKF